jgi:ubiquinone biosynthesis protein
MLSIRTIGVIGRTYRHLNRYRQILSIFFKFGFGDLIERLRLDQYLEVGLRMISKKERPKDPKLTRAERLRMAVEELGPAYIKLGQILSTRPDLVPADFIEELSKLQDNIPPCPFTELRPIIEDAFSGPLETHFEHVEESPLASASIGQVHRARLHSGEDVAVKVQRPGIRRVIEVDLEIMLHLATLMERHIAELAPHRPVTIVEEFARTLEKELDFSLEAANIRRFARDFEDNPAVHIPKVYKSFSTPRVLTMEFVEGIKISRIDLIDAAGMDRRLLTERGADLILKQVFINGFFHADPHPGNLFVLPDHVICMLDFGMVGIVDRGTRERFVDLIESVVKRDEPSMVEALLQLTDWEHAPDIRQMQRDVADFISRYLYRPLGEIRIGACLKELILLAARHRLRIPPDLFLMIKAFATVEGIARQLDPDFDMVAAAKPFLVKINAERFSPRRIAGEVLGLSRMLLKLGRQFPRDILDIARVIRQQQLKLTVTHQGLQEMLATHDRISNRISFSIIIAALIVGSALIVISKAPPLFYGISVIGIIGFLAAAVMGIWLLIAILWKGKL